MDYNEGRDLHQNSRHFKLSFPLCTSFAIYPLHDDNDNDDDGGDDDDDDDVD